MWKGETRWDQVRPGKTRWDQVRSLRPLPQFLQFLQVPLEFWKVPQAVEVLALKQDNVVHRCLEGIKAQGNGIREKINKFHNVSSVYKFLLLLISMNCIWLLEIVNHVVTYCYNVLLFSLFCMAFFHTSSGLCFFFFWNNVFSVWSQAARVDEEGKSIQMHRAVMCDLREQQESCKGETVLIRTCPFGSARLRVKWTSAFSEKVVHKRKCRCAVLITDTLGPFLPQPLFEQKGHKGLYIYGNSTAIWRNDLVIDSFNMLYWLLVVDFFLTGIWLQSFVSHLHHFRLCLATHVHILFRSFELCFVTCRHAFFFHSPGVWPRLAGEGGGATIAPRDPQIPQIPQLPSGAPSPAPRCTWLVQGDLQLSLQDSGKSMWAPGQLVGTTNFCYLRVQLVCFLLRSDVVWVYTRFSESMMRKVLICTNILIDNYKAVPPECTDMDMDQGQFIWWRMFFGYLKNIEKKWKKTTETSHSSILAKVPLAHVDATCRYQGVIDEVGTLRVNIGMPVMPVGTQ